jgi:hypothetical protein
MASSLASSKSALAWRRSSARSFNLLQHIVEAVDACARANAAAQYYEELKSMSDEALAKRGLTRADLPRAAFDRLGRGA